MKTKSAASNFSSSWLAGVCLLFALVISGLPASALAVEVTGLEITSDRVGSARKCDGYFLVTAKLTVDGPGTVYYWWETSDPAMQVADKARRKSFMAKRALRFREAGTQVTKRRFKGLRPDAAGNTYIKVKILPSAADTRNLPEKTVMLCQGGRTQTASSKNKQKQSKPGFLGRLAGKTAQAICKPDYIAREMYPENIADPRARQQAEKRNNMRIVMCSSEQMKQGQMIAHGETSQPSDDKQFVYSDDGSEPPLGNRYPATGGASPEEYDAPVEQAPEPMYEDDRAAYQGEADPQPQYAQNDPAPMTRKVKFIRARAVLKTDRKTGHKYYDLVMYIRNESPDSYPVYGYLEMDGFRQSYRSNRKTLSGGRNTTLVVSLRSHNWRPLRRNKTTARLFVMGEDGEQLAGYELELRQP